MCAAKSPISHLQELTVMKHMPFPQYNFSQQGTGFKCVGIVGQVSATAIAESKKRAKHLCAERILELLEPLDHKHSSVTVIANHNAEAGPILHSQILKNPVVQVQQVYVKAQEPYFNAVGKLNELCSQNGQKYPTYEEAGIVDQKFVIQCKLLSHTTQGQASTKKQAKQLAAKEMLNRITLPDLCMHSLKGYDFESKQKPKSDPEVEEKILELFMRNMQRLQIQTDSFSKSPDYLSEVEGTDIKVEPKIEQQQPEPTEEHLKDQLQKFGITYKISELQRNPVILILETAPTNKLSRYTFMHLADTHKLAVIGLLKKAVRDIKLMSK